MIKGNEELYAHIARPIPLLLRKSYTDDKARSYQPIIEAKKFLNGNNCIEGINRLKGSPDESSVSVGALNYLCESNSPTLVYRRNPSNTKVLGPNLLNLVKLIDNLDKFSKQISKNPNPLPFYVPMHNDNTLVFESRFECGNLELAIKVSDTEYNLVLQNDTNTAGSTQWFFFRVSNTRSNLKVKFNMINLGKGDSLFNYGMKVLVYSEIDEKSNNKGWTRGGEDILYYPNSMYKPNTNKPLYTITFSYTFEHSNDVVYFAYSYPYTYTDLMKYLVQLENDPCRNNYISRKLLCYTISGNRCDYLTITSSDIPEYTKHRKGIVISARVHPGESVGSWMMHGVIDFLTGPSKEAALIRDNFVVKVIPMLNPDGVINGNYRSNLAGNDLNRKWKAPCRILQPTIYAAKALIKAFSRERKIELVCDLHGHSRRMNIFMYGCNFPEDPCVTRSFPLTLSKLCKSFDYKSCGFHMQKSKESTMRISIFKEILIPNVFTLEASFCGNDGTHFNTNDLMEMGKQLCIGLLVHSDCKDIPKEIQISKNDLIKELNENTDLLVDNPDTSGSDSEPSEDNLDEQTLKSLMPKILKKKKKKKKSKTQLSEKHEKKNISISNKRDNLPGKDQRKSISIDKRLESKKCPDCGELDLPGHVCSKKISKHLSSTPTSNQRHERVIPTSYSSLSIYTNFKGKKVRDQATQTMYIRKIPSSSTRNPYTSVVVEKTPSPSKYRLEHFVDTKKLKQVIEYDEIALPNLKNHFGNRFSSPEKMIKLH